MHFINTVMGAAMDEFLSLTTEPSGAAHLILNRCARLNAMFSWKYNTAADVAALMASGKP